MFQLVNFIGRCHNNLDESPRHRVARTRSCLFATRTYLRGRLFVNVMDRNGQILLKLPSLEFYEHPSERSKPGVTFGISRTTHCPSTSRHSDVLKAALTRSDTCKFRGGRVDGSASASGLEDQKGTDQSKGRFCDQALGICF